MIKIQILNTIKSKETIGASKKRFKKTKGTIINSSYCYLETHFHGGKNYYLQIWTEFFKLMYKCLGLKKEFQVVNKRLQTRFVKTVHEVN